MNKIYRETIDNPKQFVDVIVRSALSNRETFQSPIEVIEVNVGDTDVFNFSMEYEEKIRLFNMGYST
jgi:NTE family protein